MRSKIITGTLLTAFISFFLSWAIWGFLVDDYYAANMVQCPGYAKQHQEVWAMVVAHLAWGLLFSLFLQLAGANTIWKGIKTGSLFYSLLTLGENMFNIAYINLMGLKIALIDVLVNACYGAILGAALGIFYSRYKLANNRDAGK
jgi:hypothetical protein